MSNKFTQLLSTLSHKELKRFADFLSSPYFNKKEEISKFGIYQIEAALKKEIENLTDEETFKYIFPKEPYKRDRLYRLRSECLILLENFIIYDQINPKEGIQHLSLLYHYAQKDLHKHFEEESKVWKKQMTSQQIHNADYYYNAYMAENLMRFYQTKNKIREKNMEKRMESINLEAFYTMNLLDNLMLLLSNSNIIKHNISQKDLLKKINETIHKIEGIEHLRENILIKISILGLEMLKAKDDEIAFETMRALLAQNTEILPKDVLRNEYIRLGNFCIHQINMGKHQYHEINFDLYKHQIEIGLIYNHRGRIPVSTFRNILITALRIGEQTWAENFLETHKEKLLSEKPEMMYEYCKAKILFEQEKFQEAKQILLTVKLRDLFLNLDIRRMLIKSYYEMKDMQLVGINLEKFHVYLFRLKEIAENHREKNQMFYSLLKRIIDYMPGELHKREKMLKEAKTIENIVDKEWLLKKIQALR